MNRFVFLLIFLLSAPAVATEEIYTLLKEHRADEAYELLRHSELHTIEDVLLLGNLARQHGKLEHAIAVLRGGIHSYPTDPRPHFELGVTHIWNSEPAKAYVRFLNALELDPHYLPARLNLTRVAIWEGRFSEARTALIRLDKDAPKDVSVQLLHGLYATAFLDRPNAAKHYGAALRLDPDNEEALRGTSSLDSLWKLELSIGATGRLIDETWRFGPSVGGTYRFSPRFKCSGSATALTDPLTVAELSASCGAILDGRRFLTLSATTFNLAEAAGVEGNWSERWTDDFLTSFRLRYGINDGNIALRGQASYRLGNLTPMVGWRVAITNLTQTAVAGVSLELQPVSLRNESYYELDTNVFGTSMTADWKMNGDIRLGASVALRFTETTSTQTTLVASYAF